MVPPTLLTLPYDIKEMIFKEVLCQHEAISIRLTEGVRPAIKCKGKYLCNTKVHTGILYTCSSVYEDAVYILYHFNKFDINYDLAQWIQTIGMRNLGVVSFISFDIYMRTMPFRNVFKSPKLLAETKVCDPYRRHIETDLLTSLATNANALRTLVINYGFAPQDSESFMLHHLSILIAIPRLAQLKTLVICGNIPHLVPFYLNRTLGIPVILNWVRFEDFKLKQALSKSTEKVRRARRVESDGSPEEQNLIPELNDDFSEPSINLLTILREHRNRTGHKRIGNCFIDDPDKYKVTASSIASESDGEGMSTAILQIFQAEEEHMEKGYSDTAEAFSEQSRIDTAKTTLLETFWEELKDLELLSQLGHDVTLQVKPKIGNVPWYMLS
jgi:hypothetical protein